MESGGADFDDRRAELLNFFVGEAVDGFELGEILRTGEDDAAEGGGGEDEEEREIEFFGLGFAPVAEALVEGLLLGGEGFWFGCGGAGAGEGLCGGGIYPRREAPRSFSAERPKAEALGYLEATTELGAVCEGCDGFGLDVDFLSEP